MKLLMSAAEMETALNDIAESLAADRQFLGSLALVGIRRRGVPLANRIAERLQQTGAARPEVGSLDIAFYRDDLSQVAQQPLIGVTDISFSLDGRAICLIDDVLFTGRTVRAGLDALLEFGRPHCIRLAVLVDRGHRELPIQADYVGLKVVTDPSDDVRVMIQPIDDRDEVVIDRWETAS